MLVTYQNMLQSLPTTIKSRLCSKPWSKANAEVRSQSEANVRLHDLLGKKRERETPFLEGEAW